MTKTVIGGRDARGGAGGGHRGVGEEGSQGY
jgi:hypothetical protein